MSGELRRDDIIKILHDSKIPISGTFLSNSCKVSRQIIVQDIALLRAKGHDIISTNRGYVLRPPELCKRVIKVAHSDSQIEDELSTIVNLGGTIIDVIVKHNIYGEFKALLNISSIQDVMDFINKMNNGEAVPLKNVTDNIHYHTISAENDEILDNISKELRSKKYLQDS